MSSLLAAALWFATLTAVAGEFDLQGSTRHGDMPEAHVVVWLESPALPRALDSRRTVLDQRNLRFSPRVLAVQVGTTVDFPNNDRVFHNVFSFRDGNACLLVASATAPAQSLTSELSVVTGASSEEVATLGTQARLFGELESEIRVYLEGAWAARSDVETDAFGAAYPYAGRLQLVEAYAERIVHRGPWLAGARLGRYRTPFGIYARSDHAYTGFLRAPLIRYDDYYGLSNHFLEGGVNMMVGTPGVNAEISLGVPQDIGTAVRQPGFDPVIHVQAYRGSFVFGFSHLRSKPYERRSFAQGQMVFTGIDVRWMQSGVQLRGEYIAGRPFDSVSTDGWYNVSRTGADLGVGRLPRVRAEDRQLR